MARKGSKARERRLRSEGKPLQAAAESFRRKGTEGAFGPATKENIARGKRAGGLQKKRAVFAENMRKLAARRRSRGSARR
jgi:hypothetical protein